MRAEFGTRRDAGCANPGALDLSGGRTVSRVRRRPLPGYGRRHRVNLGETALYCPECAAREFGDVFVTASSTWLK
jgi:hypothetical protein